MAINNSINTRILPTIYVSNVGSDTNGTGTISNPFATYEHARQVALLTATAIAPHTVGMIGIFDIVGDLILSPFVNLAGLGTGSSTVNVSGQVLLDPSFGVETNPITNIQNISLSVAGNINLVFPAFQASTLHFDNVDFKDTAQFNATGSGTNVDCELVVIKNCISIVTQPVYVFTNVKGGIVNSNIVNTTSINNSAITNNFFILTAPVANMGNCTMQTTSTGTMLAVVQGCFNPGSTITIDGTGVQLLIDRASYGVLPTFLNGATFSQVQLVSLADGVAANNNFTPVNYTPTAAAAYKANSLTGNLKGIDNALAGIASGNVVLQNGSPIYGADVGATDAYAITLTPNPGAYVEGLTIRFKANTGNTAGATLNVNGLGAVAILKFHDQVLATGDIEPGQISTVVYDGTNFQLQSAVAIAPGGGTVTSVGITSTGGTVTITGSPVTGSGNINLEVTSTGRLLNVRTINSGTGATYTPTTGTTKIVVQMKGGGGGGAGTACTASTFGAAGGGGGGGFVQKYITGVTGAYSATYTIGAAGNGGAAGTFIGTAGTTTTFNDGTFTLSAVGGNNASTGGLSVGASTATVQGFPGIGGDASGGDINLRGGTGSPGFSSNSPGNLAIGGNGGGCGNGQGGGGGLSSTGVVNGIAASANSGGGGGGGACIANAAGAAGGAGAAGQIVIFEYS